MSGIKNMKDKCKWGETNFAERSRKLKIKYHIPPLVDYRCLRPPEALNSLHNLGHHRGEVI